MMFYVKPLKLSNLNCDTSEICLTNKIPSNRYIFPVNKNSLIGLRVDSCLIKSAFSNYGARREFGEPERSVKELLKESSSSLLSTLQTNLCVYEDMKRLNFFFRKRNGMTKFCTKLKS